MTPWTVAYQGPLSMGFSRQEYWSGLPFPSLGDLPKPGIEPGSPALQVGTLLSEPLGKPNFVQLFVTHGPQHVRLPSLSTVFQSLFKFMSIQLVMLSNHLILCCSPLLLPSIFPNIRVFSNESALCIGWKSVILPRSSFASA